MVGVIPLVAPRDSNIESLNCAIKRAFDVMVASMLLLITAPVMLCTALLIRLFDGKPVVFCQTRVGLHGRPFDILKFRTMRSEQFDTTHREYLRQLIREERPAADAGSNGAVFKKSNPRTTRLGRFLRRLSIDELPQLFNVLRGEMSLIGPRPSVFYELEFYQNWHRRRLQALPGISGVC
jgi:lipopolysaccharide/colanic/teichoic acid biosynthesis glycosyltransferase